MYIQVMTEEQTLRMPCYPFDLTKSWFKSKIPLIEVGYYELNSKPVSYFDEVNNWHSTQRI